MAVSVSVVVPCFNASRWIRETLRSVFEQDCPSCEIIVINDGSTDDTSAIIQNEFGCVRLENTINGGASRARNIGTQLARGEFIQYLDADDLLAPGKLTCQVAALRDSDA